MIYAFTVGITIGFLLGWYAIPAMKRYYSLTSYKV